MKEIITSWAKDNQIKITSPVIGAFISAWILCNWQRFLLLFWGDGKLPERLRSFQESANFSDLHLSLYPLVLALIYVFALPYLNVLTQRMMRHAATWRHEVIVDTDIAKEKKLALLNEEKYKSNPENDYLGNKIKFELEKKEAEVKKLKAEADKEQSEAESVAAEAKEAVAIAEQEEAKEKSAKLELEKQQRVDEKEQQSHEIAKANFQQKLINRRFPTFYIFANKILELINEQGYKLSLSVVTKLIVLIFGFNNEEELFNDENFNHEELEKLSFVVYDPSTFIDDLQSFLEEHDIAEIKGDELFDCIEGSFQSLDICNFISKDLIEEEVINVAENEAFELIHDETVSGAMAETNAFFDGAEDIEFIGLHFDRKRNSYEAKFNAVVTGQSHEEKGFCGDTIDVRFSYIYEPKVGVNGLEQPALNVISASVRSYHDE